MSDVSTCHVYENVECARASVSSWGIRMEMRCVRTEVISAKCIETYKSIHSLSER